MAAVCACAMAADAMAAAVNTEQARVHRKTCIFNEFFWLNISSSSKPFGPLFKKLRYEITLRNYVT
jgi:hypothetical protein